jgi:hypothetical protein
LEQVVETAQAGAKEKGKENEHSEGWLNDFSQEAEEAAALKLTAEAEAEAEATMSVLRNNSITSARKLKSKKL